MPFFDAISQACLLSPYQILTVDGLTIALYIDPQTNHFLLFDSHERNRHGLRSDDGTAVLISYDTLDELFDFLFVHYTDHSYELTPGYWSNILEHGNTQRTAFSYS